MNLLLLVFIVIVYSKSAIKKFEMDLDPIFVESDFQERNIIGNALFEETNEFGTKRYLESVAQEVTNFRNLQYYGVLYIGPKKQKMRFLYDTFNPEIIIPTTLCDKCKPHKLYDINDSLGLPKVQKLRQEAIANIQDFELEYDDGTVYKLVEFWDDVYLSKDGDQVIENVWMFGILETNNKIQKIPDGVLGLGPWKFNNGRINFINTLKIQGIIDHEIASFDYKPAGMKSKVIFGGIDTETVENESDIVWIPMKERNGCWAFSITSVFYGDSKLHYQPKYAVVDTASSDLVLADSMFLDFMVYHLNRTLDWSFSSGLQFVEWRCEDGLESFPKFTFNINGYDLVLDPEEYILQAGKSWTILIMDAKRKVDWEDTIIFGVSFLRKYYTIFDIKNSKIGFYGKGISINNNSIPEHHYSALVLVFCGGVPVVVILIVCGNKYRDIMF